MELNGHERVLLIPFVHFSGLNWRSGFYVADPPRAYLLLVSLSPLQPSAVILDAIPALLAY